MSEESRRAELAKKIVNMLAEEEGLTVAEASEILLACNKVIKERTLQAMTREEAKPLSEALNHLNRSNIKVVQSIH